MSQAHDFIDRLYDAEREGRSVIIVSKAGFSLTAKEFYIEDGIVILDQYTNKAYIPLQNIDHVYIGK